MPVGGAAKKVAERRTAEEKVVVGGTAKKVAEKEAATEIIAEENPRYRERGREGRDIGGAVERVG